MDVSTQEMLEIKETKVCQVCGRTNKEVGRDLSIDHCHATLTIRGVLCNGCNSALGHAQDDPEILRALADYLENSRLTP